MQICHMDHEALARGVMRALRGRRSQTAFSRRLGYATNVAYAWEAGRRFPTAAEMLRAAARAGVDVRRALTPFFYRHLPDDLAQLEPTSPTFVAALLRDLRGPAPMQGLAERTGLSRSAVSRILAGKTEPRLPAFFRLVDAVSRRLLDLLAGLVDVSAIPAARDEWRRLEAVRRLAAENPLSEAVPRFLELEQYARLPRHRPGWIAERLGIARADEERTLRDLETAGVICWDGARWQLDRERSVDTTRFDPGAATFLRAHWTDTAAARIRAGGDGTFSYLVFSTDDATLAAMRELHLRYFRELRALAASAPRNTRVGVAIVQLFALDDAGS
ncbi:MAG TPA: helix-turn-helix transcriptional regulator [Kofleriaceae bacterium]|nr:helix-turn-helix transcriptional regulator [Kofleriaceae bacterium]